MPNALTSRIGHNFSVHSFFIDVTLMYSEVQKVLQSVHNFKTLCLELRSIPPPPNNSSYSKEGIMLWLLISSQRTWMDLAWGLYNTHQDLALERAKSNVTVSDGESSRISWSLFSIITFSQI